MNISIKESMLIRKCINDYVLENKLDYDKSPLFSDLMHKLKDNESINNPYNIDICNNDKEFINILKDTRKSLNKELKKYSIQTTCNEKILELIKKERMQENAINKSLLSKMTKNEIIELMMLNKKEDK